MSSTMEVFPQRMNVSEIEKGLKLQISSNPVRPEFSETPSWKTGT